MDFELSDEQKLFRDTLRSFVDREIKPVAKEWEHTGRYPHEIVATMKELGLFGLTITEDYGGMGADLVSLAIAFEEISKGWMGIAGILGSHSLASKMIGQWGTDEQKATLPARPGDGGAAHLHRAHRTRCRVGPAVHHHQGGARR